MGAAADVGGGGRQAFDVGLYQQHLRRAGCFICRVVAGDPTLTAHVVLRTDEHIAMLAEYPQGDTSGVVLDGYVLLAPLEHRIRVIADFSLEEYLRLQAVVHRLGRAIEAVMPTERLYLMSLGSNQLTSHVHWHLAPLPPGVPPERQQFESLAPSLAGIKPTNHDEMAATARSIAESYAALGP